MTAKLGKSTVGTNGDSNDMFDFVAHLTSPDTALYDGFFGEKIDLSERSYDPVKVDTPTSGLLVTGTEHDDSLYGSELNDEIYGLAGNDRIDAGGGNDLLFGGLGNDTLFGGAGVDTVSYAGSDAPINAQLFSNLVHTYRVEGDENGEHTHLVETDMLYSVERVIGSNYDDYMYGGQNGGLLDGGGGNDYLFGGGTDGLTVLVGGDGDDRLYSGSAATWMTGGSGADEFVFGIAGPSTVTDFTSGVDKIWDVASVYENGLPLGHDWILATGTELPTARNADGDALFYDTDDYALYELWYDDDGQVSDTFLLATFTNGIQLEAGDFMFV
ncbi:MAG: hypothetical protein K2Y71_26640 [Xanthobacteraceae bacterium]|nr:hypothetical protein [Xanthobacteraceae bacterium]